MPEALSGRPHLVLDTTVLSNFAMIGQVSLLEQLYRQHACTALMVAEEIQRGWPPVTHNSRSSWTF